jgi:mannosyl-oligosaccharide alpha-1,2-mannosidase
MLAYGAMSFRQFNWTEQLDMGVKFTETCYRTYELSRTGLGAESVDVQTLLGLYGQETYRLRPEVIESIFYMWRITHDPKYREWGWNIVQSIEKFCRDEVGYHGIQSSGLPSDRMESYFLAETLKYLYLLFSDDDVLPLDQYVFNTEAHPLSIRGHGRRKSFISVDALLDSWDKGSDVGYQDVSNSLLQMVAKGALSE